MVANGGVVDGFIISLAKETQQRQDFNHLVEVENQGMPLVMIDRITDKIPCDKVIIDDARAAYNAVSHLIEKGRKRIALITTEDYLTVGNLRTQGYTKAIADHGIDFDPALILKIDSIDECEGHISTLVKKVEFDAVFTVNETFAVVAMKKLQAMGKNVPTDIAIVGFSDGKLLKYATPSVTTIRQHGAEMGRIATKMLLKRLKAEGQEESFSTRVIKTTLIERESTS